MAKSIAEVEQEIRTKLDQARSEVARLEADLKQIQSAAVQNAWSLVTTYAQPEQKTEDDHRGYVACPECGQKLQVDGPGSRKPTVHYSSHDKGQSKDAPELDVLRKLPRLPRT